MMSTRLVPIQARAALVSIKDEKSKLDDDQREFDCVLGAGSLSSSQIMQEMELNAGLAICTDNAQTQDKPTTNSTEKTDTSTRGAENQESKQSANQQEQHPESSKSLANIKPMENQRKFTNPKTEKLKSTELQEESLLSEISAPLKPQMTSSAESQSTSTLSTSPSPIHTTCHVMSKSPERMESDIPSTSPIHTKRHVMSKSPERMELDVPSTSPSPVNTTDQVMPKSSERMESDIASTSANSGSEIQTDSPLPLFISQADQNQHSSFTQDPSLPRTPSDLFQALDSAITGDFQVDNASDCLANRTAQNSVDFSKCMLHIGSLTQRVNNLEEKVNSITSADKSSLYTRLQSQIPVTQSTQGTLDPTTISAETIDSLLEQDVSFSSEVKVPVTDLNADVELVPGYGVKLTVQELGYCLRKAKDSGTAVARLLCDVFFDVDTLSRSCARGTKTRPPLNTKIVDAIIAYVHQKWNISGKDCVQAINQKCTDVRGKLQISESSKNSFKGAMLQKEGNCPVTPAVKCAEMAYKCQECGKALTTKYNLERHIRGHAKRGKYACCGMMFPDKPKLLRHRANKHGGQRNFVCAICAKEFTSQSQLNEHAKTHTKEKGYIPCQQCGLKVKCERDLREHRAIHSHEKRFQCDHCGKAYKFMNGFSRHKKIHIN